MHRALELAHLAKLREPLKALAFAAAKGSSDAVRALFSLITEQPDDPQLPLLLPAFYAHLDPSGIPDPDQLEIHLTASSHPVFFLVGPIVSLDCICVLKNRIPLEASLDLWPRIWRWVCFIHAHLEYFPGAPPKKDICIQLLRILTQFLTHDGTRRLIEATPGVGIILARAWVLLLSDAKATEPEPAFAALCHVLSRAPTAHIPQIVEEFCEGAGGSAPDLVSLIIEHIDYFVSHGDSPTCLPFLTGAITFVVNNYNGKLAEPFRKSLLSHGFPRALSRCLCTAVAFPPDKSVAVTTNCVILLGWAFQNFPGYQHVREALQAGFLRGIVGYVSQRHPKIAVPPAQWLFKTVLPPCTVYHSVLSPLQKTLEDVSDLVTTEAFLTSGVFIEWAEFLKLTKDRLIIKDYFDSDEYRSFKACDNTACAKIRHKMEFRRCSGCLSLYYCSKKCQILDWQEGRHRSLCRIIQNRRQLDQDPFSTRDKSFMRALLHAHFDTCKQDIYVRQAMRLRQYPSNHVCTLLITRAVLSVSKFPPSPRLFRPQIWMIFER
ncbi:hypothetical protein B0H10DRAFT_2441307 [Mycena sp. CBHHK59/15]|nr:hypothetical protein B0H10DRAFT_2441307 [Mycena sp. CBHHK59/15]